MRARARSSLGRGPRVEIERSSQRVHRAKRSRWVRDERTGKLFHTPRADDARTWQTLRARIDEPAQPSPERHHEVGSRHEHQLSMVRILRSQAAGSLPCLRRGSSVLAELRRALLRCRTLWRPAPSCLLVSESLAVSSDQEGALIYIGSVASSSTLLGPPQASSPSAGVITWSGGLSSLIGSVRIGPVSLQLCKLSTSELLVTPVGTAWLASAQVGHSRITLQSADRRSAPSRVVSHDRPRLSVVALASMQAISTRTGSTTTKHWLVLIGDRSGEILAVNAEDSTSRAWTVARLPTTVAWIAAARGDQAALGLFWCGDISTTAVGLRLADDCKTSRRIASYSEYANSFGRHCMAGAVDPSGRLLVAPASPPTSKCTVGIWDSRRSAPPLMILDNLLGIPTRGVFNARLVCWASRRTGLVSVALVARVEDHEQGSAPFRVMWVQSDGSGVL